MGSRIMLFLDNLQSIRFPEISFAGFIELFILFMLIYKIVKTIRDTRAWVVFKGIIFALILYLIFKLMNFYVLTTITKSLSGVILIAIVIIFSDNIRRMFERLGQRDILSGLKKNKLSTSKKVMYTNEQSINQIVEAISRMSKTKTGVLLVFEREGILQEFIDTGIKINAEITPALLENIFYDKTPLHDGATIIRDNRIEAATAYLPLTNDSGVSKDMGTRHRAAIGLTESTDAVVVVVSEETGTISYSYDGKIERGVDKEWLRSRLVDDLTIKEVPQNLSLKDAIFSNASNKIIAAILSFVVWFSYMNILSPPITKIIEDVPFQMINSGEIESNGKTYDAEEIEQTIDISISGDASQVNSVKKSDINAYIDLRKISVSNASEVVVNIPKHPDLKISVIRGKLINLKIDDLVESEWQVDPIIVKKPNKGDVFDKIRWDNDIGSVKISGPKNKINKIGKVAVNLDLSSAKDGDKISKEIDIFDKNNEKMNKDIFTIDRPVLKGEVVMNKSKEIPVRVEVHEGEGANMYVKEVAFKPETIIIAGKEDSLKKVSELYIPITISEDDIKENVYKTIKNIKVTDILGEDIQTSEDQSIIEVNIEMEPKEELPIDNDI